MARAILLAALAVAGSVSALQPQQQQTWRPTRAALRVGRQATTMAALGPEREASRRQVASAAAATLLAAAASMAGPLEASAIGPVSMELQDITYSPVECPASLKEGRIGGSLTSSGAKSVFQQCINVKAKVRPHPHVCITTAGRGGLGANTAHLHLLFPTTAPIPTPNAYPPRTDATRPRRRTPPTPQATNPSKTKIKDAGVFGFVSDEQAGASVIANNPDFRSDAGQFAQVS